MKRIKNDTRYIIRKVIIGLLIAIILSSLHSCKVLAEERPVYNVQLNQFTAFTFPNQIGSSKEIITLPSNYSSNDYKYITATSRDIINYSYSIFYNEDLNLYLYIIIPNQTYSYINSRKVKITIENNATYYDYYNQNTEEYTRVGGLAYAFVLSPNQITDFSSTLGFNSVASSKNIDTNEYFYQVTYLGSNFNDNWSLFSSNTNYLEINNEVIYDHPDFPPQGYSEIDMLNYQGVFFVPKNYSNVPIENVEGVDYIDFNYYYQGTFKDGYFPLVNTFDIKLLNEDYLSSLLVPQYVDSNFPIYQRQLPDDRGYQHYAYLIYNSNIENLISKIWYNSNYFDYYVVLNFDTFNSNITFLDRDGQENTVNVVFNRSYEDVWNLAFEDGGNDWDNNFINGDSYTNDNLNKYLSLLQFPRNFLKKVSSGTCQALTMPLPFVDSNVTLPCMSEVFQNVLGSSAYEYISLLVCLVVYYKITLSNIDCLLQCLNPYLSNGSESDKVGAIEL